MNTFSSVQFSSVTQSCPTLCDPMNRSTPGLPVHHQLPEFTQTHIHRVRDTIQPSHPLSSPSPPALNLSLQLANSLFRVHTIRGAPTPSLVYTLPLCGRRQLPALCLLAQGKQRQLRGPPGLRSPYLAHHTQPPSPGTAPRISRQDLSSYLCRPPGHPA